jgi:hypothetical protein
MEFLWLYMVTRWYHSTAAPRRVRGHSSARAVIFASKMGHTYNCQQAARSRKLCDAILSNFRTHCQKIHFIFWYIGPKLRHDCPHLEDSSTFLMSMRTHAHNQTDTAAHVKLPNHSRENQIAFNCEFLRVVAAAC